MVNIDLVRCIFAYHFHHVFSGVTRILDWRGLNPGYYVSPTKHNAHFWHILFAHQKRTYSSNPSILPLSIALIVLCFLLKAAQRKTVSFNERTTF